MVDAFGSAGTQSAGLWQFFFCAMRPIPSNCTRPMRRPMAWFQRDWPQMVSKVHDGYSTVSREWASAMSDDSDPEALASRLGERWALAETSFKWHASCRHTHPAADALMDLMREHTITANDIESVTARVHQGALDVLGPVVRPETVHQAKFSMGTVLGLIACRGQADINDFENCLADPAVSAFRERVGMEPGFRGRSGLSHALVGPCGCQAHKRSASEWRHRQPAGRSRTTACPARNSNPSFAFWLNLNRAPVKRKPEC